MTKASLENRVNNYVNTYVNNIADEAKSGEGGLEFSERRRTFILEGLSLILNSIAYNIQPNSPEEVSRRINIAQEYQSRISNETAPIGDDIVDLKDPAAKYLLSLGLLFSGKRALKDNTASTKSLLTDGKTSSAAMTYLAQRFYDEKLKAA